MVEWTQSVEVEHFTQLRIGPYFTERIQLSKVGDVFQKATNSLKNSTTLCKEDQMLNNYNKTS